MNRLAKFGVVTYVVCVLFFSFQPGMSHVSFLASVLIFVIAALVMSASNVGGGRQSFIRRIAYGWLIWLGWSTFGALFAHDIETAVKKLTTLLFLFIAFAAYSKLLKKEAARDAFRSAFIYSILGVCAFTATQPEVFSDVGGRMFGTFGNANTFGAALVFASIFESSRFLERSSFYRLCRFLAIQGIIVYFIFQTGSREAFLVFVTTNTFYISANVFWQATGKKKYWAISVPLFVLFLTLALGVNFSSEWSESRIGSFLLNIYYGSNQPLDGSASERLYFYRVASQIVQQHFLMGIGLDNFRELVGTVYGSTKTYAHSTYLEVIISTGIVGFLLYFSLYVRVSIYILRIWRLGKGSKGRAVAIKVAALILAVVMFDFADVTYYNKIFWLIFCYCLMDLTEGGISGDKVGCEKVRSKSFSAYVAHEQVSALPFDSGERPK